MEKKENKEVENIEGVAPKGVPSSTKNKDLSEEGKEDVRKKMDHLQNEQLKKMFIIFGGLIVMFILGFYIVNSTKHFEYKDVKFEIVKEGNLVFYKTALPIYSSITGKHILNNNIYLRTDPRKLKDIPYYGGIALETPEKKMVVDLKEEFNCEGYGVVAMANFVKSMKLIGIDVVKNPELSCDEEGNYNYVKIQEGDETSIKQDKRRCYTINIKDCEILEGTERFIVEAFADFDGKIYMNPESE